MQRSTGGCTPACTCQLCASPLTTDVRRDAMGRQVRARSHAGRATGRTKTNPTVRDLSPRARSSPSLSGPVPTIAAATPLHQFV